MGQIFRDEEVIPVTLLTLEEDANFEVGDRIKISGTSKGKGFQGVVKRHGFSGGPKSHGQRGKHRAGGSIGAMGPQRVFPGVRMPGRMGGDTITMKNLEVVAYEKERNLIMLKGAVPGIRGVMIKLFLNDKSAEKDKKQDKED